MKSLNQLLMSLFLLSMFVYGGGDIREPIQVIEDVEVANQVVLEEPIYEEIIEPIAPPVVIPKSIVVPPPVIAPVVVPIVPVAVISAPVVEAALISPLGFYVAAGLTVARFDPSCSCPSPISDSDKTVGLVGRIGYDFNQFFGIEARGLRTNWNSNGGKVKHFGAFFKPMYPVSNALNIYALGGYAKTTTQGSKQHVNSKSLAWGGGIEYDFGGDSKEGRYDRTFDGYGDQESGFGLFADYERLIQQSGSPDLDTISIGITYDF